MNSRPRSSPRAPTGPSWTRLALMSCQTTVMHHNGSVNVKIVDEAHVRRIGNFLPVGFQCADSFVSCLIAVLRLVSRFMRFSKFILRLWLTEFPHLLSLLRCSAGRIVIRSHLFSSVNLP